jgi:DNA invertase Pin-like site-specific DNA recombinase
MLSASVANYLNGGRWSLVKEVVEVESGKRNDCPAIAEVPFCRLHRATLIIAKLDRLARNVHFISSLMEAGVDYVAVDFPLANRLTVHILAAVAEHEASMISGRTKGTLPPLRPAA